MITDKILLLSIIASLFIHGVALYMTGMVPMRQTIPEEKILTVELKQDIAEEEKNPAAETEQPEDVPPVSAPVKQTAPPAEGKKEDTVDLGDPKNTRYRPYLLQIKKQIERTWAYPSSAASRRIEGTAIILFSVSPDGDLNDVFITRSSGSPVLDQGTIAAIRSAAPFEPLPPAYGLSKLNIQASFEYRMSN